MIKTGLLLFAISVAASAAPIVVTFDTTPLFPGTYYLDFQLNDGDGTMPNNTASIGNLQSGGGSFDGAATLDGGASGSAAAGFDIQDTASFNAALQAFTPGTMIRFVLDYSLNYDGSGFPDQLTFAILDTDFLSIVSEGNGALLTVDLTPGATPQLLPASNDFGGGSVTIEAVPEPATWMMVAPLIGLGLVVRRRN